MRPRIAVCASGAGSNFEALVRASRGGTLDAEVVGLITNRPKVGALGRAKILGVPSKILAVKDFQSATRWDQALVEQLRAWKAEWIVLAGFLALIGPEVLAAFPRRIVNSHPSLLPKYGGHGMYGDRVHEAVVKNRETQTGITIHLVDPNYDQGEVLARLEIPVLEIDTGATLGDRVKAAEHEFYPRTLHALLHGQLTTR